MTTSIFTHHLPGETVKDMVRAERDFFFDRRTAVDATPKGAEMVHVALNIPAGHRFTVRPGGYREGDPVHQLTSFETARSVCLGSTSKNGEVRVIEKGTENGGEVLLHPAQFISGIQSAA